MNFADLETRYSAIYGTEPCPEDQLKNVENALAV